jgi:hypothetical protein
MPEDDNLYGNLCGVSLPRLTLDTASGVDGAALAALAALERISGGLWRKNVRDDVVFA